MISMRQRVLLVAGWVVAAAVTSLVASGAVAVAGGQVNDRPLTKVLAADVAALPVVDTEIDPCDASPLPPAASICTAEPSSAGAQNERPGSRFGQNPVGDDEGTNDLSGLDPDRPDGLTPTIDPGDIDAADAAEAGPDLENATTSQVVNLRGGSVSFAVADDQIRIPWLIPLDGYRVRVDFADRSILRVTFARAGEENIAIASWLDGELTIETFENDL